MPREIPYIFCRYLFLRKKTALTETEQRDLLNSLKGVRIGYRIKDPTPDQRDTFAMKLRHYTFDGVGALSWCVGYDIHHRQHAEYDASIDEIEETLEDAKGIRFAQFVAIPSLGVLAVSDQHGETDLSGMAAISRFKSVVRSIKGNRVQIELAGSTADIKRAFENWHVRQFSFSVRPFNPTRRRLGGQLHDLMTKNGVFQLSGVARADANKSIDDPEAGIIGEAIGLADHGYGQVALKAVTDAGRQAVIGKPHFSPEKEKNKKRQANPRLVKVYITEGTSDRRQTQEIVKALVEFYGQ